MSIPRSFGPVTRNEKENKLKTQKIKGMAIEYMGRKYAIIISGIVNIRNVELGKRCGTLNFKSVSMIAENDEKAREGVQ